MESLARNYNMLVNLTKAMSLSAGKGLEWIPWYLLGRLKQWLCPGIQQVPAFLSPHSLAQGHLDLKEVHTHSDSEQSITYARKEPQHLFLQCFAYAHSCTTCVHVCLFLSLCPRVCVYVPLRYSTVSSNTKFSKGSNPFKIPAAAEDRAHDIYWLTVSSMHTTHLPSLPPWNLTRTRFSKNFPMSWLKIVSFFFFSPPAPLPPPPPPPCCKDKWTTATMHLSREHKTG